MDGKDGDQCSGKVGKAWPVEATAVLVLPRGLSAGRAYEGATLARSLEPYSLAGIRMLLRFDCLIAIAKAHGSESAAAGG
jgi:hypothetical protein